ncbi:hypothetical protein Enr8_38290 [Blastopirellula retiformator]|uniref:Uncharacterized protein n=1 Tax=Blastopirellula retiformator TaxID=2527970 RepID=A0A5C5UZW1_9BACT|nr:hypothetical protein Enr8_38290 [Blastopirellula retiformator]
MSLLLYWGGMFAAQGMVLPGQGCEVEFQSKLFDRFRERNATTNARSQGARLLFAQMRRILEKRANRLRQTTLQPQNVYSGGNGACTLDIRYATKSRVSSSVSFCS